MAYIDFKSDSTTITVWVAGLDEGYSYEGRIAYFELYRADTGDFVESKEAYIPAEKPKSSVAIFRYLTPSTEYYISAWITNIVGYSDVQVPPEAVWTNNIPFGIPKINLQSTQNTNSVSLMVGLYDITQDDILIGSTMMFKLYKPNASEPFHTTSKFKLGNVAESELYNLGYGLAYNTRYVLSCTIYTDVGTFEVDSVDLYYATAPMIFVERDPSNPFMASATIYGSEANRKSLYLVILYTDDFGVDEVYRSFQLSYLANELPANVSFALRDTGAHRIVIADSADGGTYWAECNLESLYNPNTIDESGADTGGQITWTISNLACDVNSLSHIFFYRNGEYCETVYFESGLYNFSVPYDFYGDNLETIQLKAEIYNDGRLVNIIGPIKYTFPPYPSATISVSRASNNPNNIYLTINNVESYHAISKIEIRTKLAGLISYETIGTITNPMTYPIDLTFYQMGMAKRRFYALITNVHGKTFTSNYTSVLFVPWEWPEQEYTLLTVGGATRDFRYSVWNDLVNRMSEAHLVATRSEWNNEDGYASYDNTLMTDTEEGRTLTALRYNSLKHQIDHNYSTGIEDVETGDPVSGQNHFINLTNKFNQWITTVLDKKN